YVVNAQNAQNVIGVELACGSQGQTGPVIANLLSPSSPVSVSGQLAAGTITQSSISPNLTNCHPGIQTLSHLIQAMREGNVYVNVRTTAYPNGEIRGQVRQ